MSKQTKEQIHEEVQARYAESRFRSSQRLFPAAAKETQAHLAVIQSRFMISTQPGCLEM